MSDLIDRKEAVKAVKNEMLSWLDGDSHDYRKVVDAIMDLPTEPQWIPVSERLPDETGSYLVTNNNCVCPVEEAVFFANGSYWTDAYIGTRFKDSYVIAWMPLPEPYEVKNDKTDTESVY